MCKEFVDVILTYISEKADSIHIITAEDIVTAVHTIGQVGYGIASFKA